MKAGLVLIIAGLVAACGVAGYLIKALTVLAPIAAETDDWGALFDPMQLLDPVTWIMGIAAVAVIVLLHILLHPGSFGKNRKFLKGNSKDAVDSALENSHFLSEKERDDLFPAKQFTKLEAEKKDGVPVYAVYNTKKHELDVNLMSPAHGIIIGSTGSGKTTTFINPTIQILANTSAKSSMIMTDPKGELFQLHSRMLSEHGYKTMVLDLRDPYSSFRWNPLEDIYDRYQEYLHTGDEIYRHTDRVSDYELTLHEPEEAYEEAEVWYEFEGAAYADRKELIALIKTRRQKIYDDLYEDLNDLISVLCPIESKDDPVWEKGAKSIILAVAIGMLEDSEEPALEMTREKYNFFNLSKAIGNSEDGYAELKKFFAGRPKLSKAWTLSRQVMSAPDDTMNSYMSIALDKMSLFNDEGICALTSATDIDPKAIAAEPTALFLKIPDEKDTRYSLAALFILSIYKALIKLASSREDLSLPRNVYYLMDEFGNMPRIEKFEKMITVGRSRKIWFEMVVQSFAQLENVYGKNVAEIIKSNCGMKMFIGSNDIETCEEFSKLCGNYSVSVSSTSSSIGSLKAGDINVSNSVQQRPLIYPSELQRLNNKNSTGNAIIVTFGNYPLKTRFTPSYKCPLYQTGAMDLTEVKSHAFFGEEVYYDLEERNYRVEELKAQEEEPETEPEEPDLPEESSGEEAGDMSGGDSDWFRNIERSVLGEESQTEE